MSNNDLISRAAAIAEIDEYIEEYSELEPETGYHNLKWCAMSEAKDVLTMLPAIDATPTIRAEWVKEDDRVNHWHCSNCDNAFGQVVYFYKFCPFCGASMTVKDQTNL